ncbi:PaaI family thioesterase [Mycolicibacterium sp. P1-5]|uniref:PaaI family thioesterase n=1 Tax=Mycolicibacterium sp. P1-5 TaxID=2024617 RepID=UPI0011EDC28B|nr:PaaI family thioesterase [Mycolicibacterium sp. P1-5]KAA0110083.1 PaaI family thioesterase [Mycolicibacterium sp. P1-5]
MSTPDGPQGAFCVGLTGVSEAGIALQQQLCSALVDHRGLIEMPAYAVMAESVTSGAYWYSFAEPVTTVQSWLALTAGARPHVGDRLHAVSVLAHHDDAHGTATMTVTNSGGQARSASGNNGSYDVVCSGVARAVRVGRTTEALRTVEKRIVVEPDELPAPPDVDTTVSSIDPDWDGPRTLTAISRGEIARGPLCELLAMTVDTDDDDPVITVDPQSWMANPLGAIQGGVIASMIGQACSLAGQAHTGPGDRYALADLSVFYFRSPPVDGRRLTLTTTTDRVGGRMATVEAAMTDAEGTRYVRAVANIAYERG